MVNKETLRSMSAEQVMQQLQEVKERRRSAIERANDAIRGYEKAVAARNAKIKELREDLHKQLTGIEGEVATLNAAMLQASITGDGAKADEAQRFLTELEGQQSQLNACLESLAGSRPGAMKPMRLWRRQWLRARRSMSSTKVMPGLSTSSARK